MKRFIVLFAAVIALLSCEKNNPPLVESFTAKPDSVFPGDTVQINYSLWDDDLETIFRQLTAQSGELFPSDSYPLVFPILWIAPKESGQYYFYLEINDGKEWVKDSVSVYVNDTMGTFIDPRDNYAYDWVKIGKQIWMAENLSYLPSVNNPHFKSFDKPFYYVAEYYGEDVMEAIATSYYKEYGVFYNYEAAETACPSNWHLPSVSEWNLLFEYLGMDKDDLDKGGYRHSGSIGLKLKSTSGWYNNCNGENLYGFTAIPAGAVSPGPLGNNFIHLGDAAYFRTAFSLADSLVFSHNIYRCDEGITTWCCSEADGVSIRCIKDDRE